MNLTAPKKFTSIAFLNRGIGSSSESPVTSMPALLTIPCKPGKMNQMYFSFLSFVLETFNDINESSNAFGSALQNQGKWFGTAYAIYSILLRHL